MEDDALLTKKCQSGSISAFEEIVKAHRDRILKLVYRITGNFEDANDISQEVFIRAYKSIKSLRGDASFETWLNKIAINLSINHIGKESRRKRGNSELSENREDSYLRRDNTPLDIVEIEEITCRFRESIKSLPIAERVVFILKVQQGLSYKEIADAVKCPMGTVMSRLNRARRRLRDSFKDYTV